jgi:hypothetical protein
MCAGVVSSFCCVSVLVCWEEEEKHAVEKSPVLLLLFTIQLKEYDCPFVPKFPTLTSYESVSTIKTQK